MAERRGQPAAGVRVNLGSGEHRTPTGWISVDVDPHHRPAILADVTALPFADGSAERLMASHLLEHIPLAVLPAVLAELRRVLAPDGTLCVVGPDIDRAVSQRQPQWLLEAIVTHGAGPGAHAWCCSETVLRWLLEREGWEVTPVDVATVTAPEWANPAPEAGWQLALLCR